MQQLTVSFIALLALTLLSACTQSSDTVVSTQSNASTQATPQGDIGEESLAVTPQVVTATPTTTSSTPRVTTTTVSPSTASSISIQETPTTIQKSVSYRTDHGKKTVAATYSIITDTAGTITAVSAVMTSGDRESSRYINRFNSAAKSQIVGKKISSLSLSAVGGASDTTDAFIQVLGSL